MTGGAVTFGGARAKTAWSGLWPNGDWWVGTYIGLPTGNLNLDGNRVVNIDSSYINGIGSGDAYKSGLESDGWARIWYHTYVYFDIDGDEKRNVYSSKEGVNFDQGGGLSGGYSWSTVSAAPSGITAVRTTNSVAVSPLAPSDNGGTKINNYYAQSSSNNGATWSAAVDATGSIVFQNNNNPGTATFSNLTLGNTYKFRVYATNARGDSQAYVSSSIYIPKVPTAPTSISAVASARSVTVTCNPGGVETGGSAITNYYAQSSSDNGVTWSTAQAMGVSTRSYIFTGLTAGATYKFRCYATNEMGNSPTITSNSITITAVGQRYRGASETQPNTYQPMTIASRYDGTNWVPITVSKKYTNGQWVDFV